MKLHQYNLVDEESMHSALDELEAFPDILTIYFPGFDGYSHYYGPQEQEYYLQTYVDVEIGKLLFGACYWGGIDCHDGILYLKADGVTTLYDETIIVITADHGQTGVVNDTVYAVTKAEVAGSLYQIGYYCDNFPYVDPQNWDCVIAQNGGMTQIYIQNGLTFGGNYYDGTWSLPPAWSDVYPAVDYFYSQLYVDRILVKYQGSNGYRVYTGSGTTQDLETFFAGRPNYIDAVERIKGLDSARSGDIILLANYIGSYYFNDDPEAGTHGNLNPDDTYIPLVFSGPTIRKGVTETTPARNIDMAPTLANLLGFSMPNADGKPLPVKKSQITSCQNITSPGVYELQNDILNVGGRGCINITVSNVVIDGQGHTISSGTGWNDGIFNKVPLENITIKNIVLKNFYDGVLMRYLNDSLITNITAIDNIGGGVVVSPAAFRVNITNSYFKNGNVDGSESWNVAVGGTSNLVENNIILQNSNTWCIGVLIDGVNSYDQVLTPKNIRNTIRNNTIMDNWIGIFITPSLDTLLENNQILNFSRAGVGFNSNVKNAIVRNNIIQTTSDGIEHPLYGYQNSSAFMFGDSWSKWWSKPDISPSGNLIYNNKITAPYFITTEFWGQPNKSIDANYWSINRTIGTNIIGGPYISGNAWFKPDGTGFSVTCPDFDNNEICDSSYTLASDNVDYLPLSVNNTPIGTNVKMEFDGVNITFANVNDVGKTSVGASATGRPPPTGFSGAGNYYDITTTATYAGDITVCINYNDTEVVNESALRLFHYEGGSWVDITTTLDTNTNIICGMVLSLSEFIVVEPDAIPPTITITSPANTTYEYGSPITISYSSNEAISEPDYYSLDGGSNTSFVNASATITLGIGSHSLRIWAKDASGNWGSDMEYFTVADATPPAITFVPPTDPSGITITDRNYTFINVTLSESGTAWLEWNGTNESMLGGSMNWYLNKTNLTNGNYTYRVYANDSTGNLNVSETRTITINKLEGGGPTIISSCKVINSPGSYVLNTSIINSGLSTCISITSSNVIFDGSGYIIDGKDKANTYGVYVYNSTRALTNITVKNLRVTDWGYGIVYRNAANGTIVSSYASSNAYGMTLASSTRNILAGSAAYSNTKYGIYLSSSGTNLIYNNFFNNTNNFRFGGTTYANYWNITKTLGTNIVGGPYFGGNYWANPSGTGFSQTCADANGDRICDSAYALASGNVDYLPLK